MLLCGFRRIFAFKVTRDEEKSGTVSLTQISLIQSVLIRAIRVSFLLSQFQLFSIFCHLPSSISQLWRTILLLHGVKTP